MKNILSILLIMLSFACFAKESDVETTKEDINNVLLHSVECWNKSDLQCFIDTLYVKSDKTIFISGTKFIHGWQNLFIHYQQKYGTSRKDMGHLQIKLEEIEILDNNHAFAYGTYHLETKKKIYDGVTSLLFLKSHDKWKIIADHSS